MEVDGTKKIYDRQIENFEAEIESLKLRHRKEKESLEIELEEKKHLVMRQAADIKEFS